MNLNPFKNKAKLTPNEERKKALKALKEAQSKVFGMLDDYARAGDVETVADILEGTQFKKFKHLLDPKWWGTSEGELRTGKTFLQSLLEKLRDEHKTEADDAITEFNHAILKIKKPPKPILKRKS